MACGIFLYCLLANKRTLMDKTIENCEFCETCEAALEHYRPECLLSIKTLLGQNASSAKKGPQNMIIKKVKVLLLT